MAGRDGSPESAVAPDSMICFTAAVPLSCRLPCFPYILILKCVSRQGGLILAWGLEMDFNRCWFSTSHPLTFVA